MTRLWLALSFIIACAHAQESRVVRTAQGQVRGYKSEDGVYQFFGIPYATAPTGSRRYSAPLPGPKWLNILEAVDTNIFCPQGSVPFFDISSVKMQENCLVANIHVPDTENTNLPVIVYVHGGAYQVAYGEFITPKRLVKSKKLIAVTFNYRLGVHGFLCLGTNDVPGNAGMKDQVALLRWVKENIANFGGNPDDVTIAGYSAGSSAVDLLMLSKSAEGLFNKAIPESGANVGVWSVQIDPVQNARDFAKELNFTDTGDIFALEEFYKSASLEKITSNVFLARPDSTFVFVPCVESNTVEEKFLHDTPVNILKEGKYRKVPMLYGFANMEGLFRIPQFYDWIDGMNNKFSDFLPADLQFTSEEEKEHVSSEIKRFYFGDKRVGEETALSYIDYFSDVIFAYPYLRSAKLQVEAGNNDIYLYEYSYCLPFPQGPGSPEFVKNICGAGHTAQTLTILGITTFFNITDSSEQFKQMSNTLQEIWTNFVIHGKPVPDGSNLPSWPPVGSNWSPYMDLNKELKLKGPLLELRARFWEDIYDRYYRSPIPPTTQQVRSEL